MQEQVGVGVPVALSGVGDRTCLCGWSVRVGCLPSLGKEGLVGNPGRGAARRAGDVRGGWVYNTPVLSCIVYYTYCIIYCPA